MRVDPETWDNIYDIPAELAPMIQEMTAQNLAYRNRLGEIYAVTKRFKDNLPHGDYHRAVLQLIGDVQGLVPDGLRPL
jgi:hypothetical protein